MTDRRDFMRTISLGLLAAPLAALAQAGKVLRIAVLSPVRFDPKSPRLAAFRERLHELGYVEGRNVAFEFRSADERLERLPGLAAELARLKVDVIVAITNPAIAAARKATTSIPIVMVLATDPVDTGFVASLARPGGNVTGGSLQRGDLLGKALQLLKEVSPNLSRVALLSDPGYPGAVQMRSALETAATALGLQMQVVDVRSLGDLDGAFVAAVGNQAGAAVAVSSNVFFDHRTRMAELAIKHRLPIAGAGPEYAQAGWLIGYGANFTDDYRRAAEYVSRILKGTKPAALPVEQPTKFSLAINLKTAKALGITIPQSLLLRAEEVIQ